MSKSKKAKKSAGHSALMRAISPQPKIVKDYGFFKHIELEGKGFVSLNDVQNDNVREYLTYTIPNIIGSHAFERHQGMFPLEFLANISVKLVGELHEEYGVNVDRAPWSDLFALINSRSEHLREAMKKRLEKGVIEASDLPMMFTKGTEAIIAVGEDPIGGIIEDIKFGKDFFGREFWMIGLRVLLDRKGAVEEVIRDVEIDSWRGTKPLEECPIQRKVDGDLLDRLIERGKMFRAITGEASYMRYSGILERFRWWRASYFRADGRIMVDAASFALMDSDGHEEQMKMLEIRGNGPSYGGRSKKENVVTSIKIEDGDLWRCHSHVLGFSFRAKQWGRMRVEAIQQIAYRADAFERLVMDPETKTMIRALVQNSGASFSDVVEGKGGGCIFLLEGEPGLGKTLTAETVAEDLRRPLYPISVGELGTDPDSLEDRLRMILDVATRWNAVLLLDEADVFLEERDVHSIERNAMVSVFLRLLEYHEGVLFLTTNRCQNIDSAFLSRISIALSFPGADREKRATIWRQLLLASKLDHLAEHHDQLGEYDVNGRQIKNAIRMAQTLALSEDRRVEISDLERTIGINEAFIKRLTEKRSKMPARLRPVA